MRLTVNLEDDLYRDARSLALAEGISISRAVNLLLRRVQSGGSGEEKAGDEGETGRFPAVACRGKARITDEDVARAEEAEQNRQWNEASGAEVGGEAGE